MKDLKWKCDRCGAGKIPCPRGGCEAYQIEVRRTRFTRREVLFIMATVRGSNTTATNDEILDSIEIPGKPRIKPMSLRQMTQQDLDNNYTKTGLFTHVKKSIVPNSKKSSNMIYEIWIEGYAASGESGEAHMIGTAKGETFDQAVEEWAKTSNYKVERNTPERYVSEEAYKNRRSNWNIWACNLFDNETDARKSFG